MTFTNPRLKAEFSDWPSGQARVQCVFEVHHDKRGCRVSRATTDKHGRWCKPKFTTYSSGAAAIVDGSDGRTYILQASADAVRIVDSDLQHDPPEDRLGHRAYVWNNGNDTELYKSLLAVVLQGGAVQAALLTQES